MKLKKANKLKRELEKNEQFDVRKVHGLLPNPDRDWNLEVYEKTQTKDISTILSETSLYYMCEFANKLECPVFVDANHNVPFFVLY